MMTICSRYLSISLCSSHFGPTGDYLSQNPESIHQVLILFSDRGTPDGYHHMHGYSGHTFKLVNKEGKFVYTQWHFRADKGFKTLSNAKAGELSGTNPDYGIQTLFEDIEKGDFPSWTVYIVRYYFFLVIVISLWD